MKVAGLSPWDVAADIINPPTDTWEPLQHQIPPGGKWFIWMLLGGRGAGKTAAAAKHVHDHVHGPPCLLDVPGGHWPSIIAPTLGDAVTSCVNGPSGLRAHCPDIKVRQTAGGTIIKWPNLVEAKLFGAHTPDDVERLRSGGNRCLVWCEELAAWRRLEEAWQHMRYGLRLGPWPHVIVSTTPKALKLIRDLVARAIKEHDKINPHIVITKGTTDDNPYLDNRVKKDLYEDYGGTRLGRQELYAEVLEDVENALWSPTDIEENRWRDILDQPHYERIIVGVDPQAKVGGNETGIIVCGSRSSLHLPGYQMQEFPHFFVLADYSLNGKPEDWGGRVVDAFNDYEANMVVAEVNNGGDMVEHVLHTIDDTLPVKKVHATRGKERRAEPISSIYQQGRGHHVGMFPELEDQMTGWDSVNPDPSWSPDRMDAMVWAATELMVGRRSMRQHRPKDRRLSGRR